VTAVIDDLKRLAGLEPYRRYLDLKPGTGGTLLAVCPWHDDRKPSLTVYSTPDPHHHCFACEAHGDAIDLIRHFDSCDVKAARERLEEIVGLSAPNIPQGPGEIKAIYRYTDEEGELLFEVLRYEPKNFRQRKPDPNGGMTWKLDDVRKPLYRLPKVLRADEVWLVEGEKDVETLERFDLTATTTAGGANAPWLSEYSDALTGKTVYIVPDNDEPGRKRAQRIRRQLQGHADHVLIVEIPGPHKDVSDFIEAGNSADDLRALIAVARSTPLVEPPWFESIATLGSLKSAPSTTSKVLLGCRRRCTLQCRCRISSHLGRRSRPSRCGFRPINRRFRRRRPPLACRPIWKFPYSSAPIGRSGPPKNGS
jgi:5S rRNA maturation endonuclease (ribonuclease M5)